MRIGSLFSGIGGLDGAVEQFFNGQLVWHCENDKHASKVLEARWPGVPNLGDITKIDWSEVEPVDLITAGYPCQPFSVAGQQRGTKDERHLWPYVAAAVRVLRPRYALLENVPGHLRLGFDGTLTDLAALGWDAEWIVVPASEVGAPHKRERLFVLAWDASGQGLERGILERVQQREPARFPSAATDPDHRRRETSCGAQPGRGLPVPVERGGAWDEEGYGQTAADPARELLDRGGRDHQGRRGESADSDREPVTLLRTPQANVVEAKGDIKLSGRSPSDPQVGLADQVMALLPSPKATSTRKSRKALTAKHWSAPDLEQSLELARGELPREYESADEVSGMFRDMLPQLKDSELLPTPVLNDMGENKTLEWWDEWAPRQKASDGRTVPHGRSLSIEVRRSANAAATMKGSTSSAPTASSTDAPTASSDKLLPTPREGESQQTMNVEKWDRRREAHAAKGQSLQPSLTTEIARLLPTPRAEKSDEDADTFQRRSDRIQKQEGRNGGPTGMPLGVAIQLLPTPRASDGAHSGPNQRDSAGRPALAAAVQPEHLLPTPQCSDAHGGKPLNSNLRTETGDYGAMLRDLQAFGPYQAAIDRWETVLGRPAPPPTEAGKDGRQRLSAHLVEWMMGFPDGWVTDPALGVSRTHQLKLLGNAVVAQQAVLALQILMQRIEE